MNRARTILRAMRDRTSNFMRVQQVRMRFPGLSVGSPIRLLVDDLAALEVGSDVSIGAFSEVVVQSTSRYSPVPGRLLIANRVSIGSHANIRAAGGTISIGESALLAQRVSLIAANHGTSGEHPFRDLPWETERCGVELGSNVWLGTGVTVLPGCRIGSGSIVGAGSIVTRDVPSGEIWAGIPARFVRKV